MSKTSKTARASMVTSVGEKKTISDEVYVKNLRYDVSNGIHATQEGAKALLREYDKEVAAVAHLAQSTSSLLKRAEDAEEALRAALSQVETLKEELAVSGAENETLKAEIAAAQAIFGTAKFTETNTTEAEAKNNHD